MASRLGRVDIVTTDEAAARLEPEWDALAVRHARAPFALPGLALGWWRHLGRGELLVIAVRGRSGDLLAVGPFQRRSIGRLAVARWLGTGLGSVAEVVADPAQTGAIDAVWTTLAGEVDALDLAEYRQDGVGLLELRRAEPWNTQVTITDLCPVLDLSGADSIDDVLTGRSNLRKKLARYDRAVAATGASFTVEAVTDVVRLHEVIGEMQEVYDDAEEARPRQHLLSGGYRPFLIEAMDTAAEHGQLVAFVGRLGPRCVAFDLAFRIGDTLADWVGRYRPEVEDLAVGHLLLREVTAWCLANDVRTIDLLLGDHEYKRRWSSGHYDTASVVAVTAPWQRPLIEAVHRLHPLRQSLGNLRWDRTR